jgi:hypothetical protein
MPFNKLVINTFTGGVSPSEKSGFDGSARVVQHLNIHDDRNHMIPSRLNACVSNPVVAGLVQWIIDGNPYDTNHYHYDTSGNLYKETSAGVWTIDRAVSSGDGSGLYTFDDYLYYTTPRTLGRKGKLTGTPAFSDDFLSDGTLNLDQSATTSGHTYTLPTSISEGSTAKKSFVPTKDPIKEIDVDLDTKGAGNWTLTLHDSKNTVIGSKTVANASLVSSGYQPFLFSTPLRVVLNATYHFHLTVSSGTSKVTTGTASDLSTVCYKEYFGILLPATFHPMENLNGLIIGNDRYLAFWDEVEYNPCRIVLPAGFSIRTISRENEFVIAGAWAGVDTDHITEVRYYYWDGIADSYNYWKPAPKLLPCALTSFKNRTISVMGRRGHIYMGTEPFQVAYVFSKASSTKKFEVNPGAITEWSGRLMMGVSSTTDDTELIQGVYGYGNNTDSDPEVLTNDFSISTGTQTGTSVQIGAVKGIGKYLYFSWRDDSDYGVDRVSLDSSPAPASKFESLIFDSGDADQMKHAVKVVIAFQSLPSGATITPKYKIDRAVNWTTGTPCSTVGETFTQIQIDLPFHEIEIGFDATCGSTDFVITGIKLYWNELPDAR